MTRQTRALINLAALRHNLSVARELAPNSQILAVIKANGYGHGLEYIGQALNDSDALAVATLNEAIRLRQAGITQPVVLLEGVIRAEDLKLVEEYQLDLVVHQQQQIDLLKTYTPSNLTVWLKINTGMNRLGVVPASVDESVVSLSKLNLSEIILMTHLANADDRKDPFTQNQIEQFNNLRQANHYKSSIANSAGILNWSSTHLDWIRPGIMLYGVTPFNSGTGAELGLKPVMTLSSELIAVNHCKQGDCIGYGGSWCCPETMPVGVVAIGYGDGYPRHIEDDTPVLVNGVRCPIIGRVSMDMLCVDLRPCQDAQPGDEVVLWGSALPVEEIAAKAGTIAYELLCQVTRRVDFEYIDIKSG